MSGTEGATYIGVKEEVEQDDNGENDAGKQLESAESTKSMSDQLVNAIDEVNCFDDCDTPECP